MARTPRDRDTYLTRARQVAEHLAQVAKESSKPGGSITLEQALRELEERERREAARRRPRGRTRRARQR